MILKNLHLILYAKQCINRPPDCPLHCFLLYDAKTQVLPLDQVLPIRLYVVPELHRLDGHVVRFDNEINWIPVAFPFAEDVPEIAEMVRIYVRIPHAGNLYNNDLPQSPDFPILRLRLNRIFGVLNDDVLKGKFLRSSGF